MILLKIEPTRYAYAFGFEAMEKKERSFLTVTVASPMGGYTYMAYFMEKGEATIVVEKIAKGEMTDLSGYKMVNTGNTSYPVLKISKE